MNAGEAPGTLSTQPPIFYGWIMVAVGFVTLAIAFGVWYSFSVFILAIEKDFGWSHAVASITFSVFIFSQASAGLVTGILQDRFGPRVVIPLGSLILAGALILTSQARELWHFLFFYGAVGGAGISLLGFSSHAAFLPRWFERRRGVAVGTAMSGIGFGMLVLIPLIEKSITGYGWRSTYLYLAGLVLFLVGPLNLIFSRYSPERLNLRPDGDLGGSCRATPVTKISVEILDNEWALQEWTIKRALLTRRFWFLVFAFFFLSYAYQGTLLHSISAMVDAGQRRETAALYFGILGIVGSGGKILLGYLSDLFGRERINSLGCTLAILGIFCLIGTGLVPGPLPLFFAFLFGLGYGAAAPLLPSISADIFQGNSFGLIFAVIAIGAGAGGAFGSFMAGFLRDVSGTYTAPLAVSCISLSLSCTSVWFAGPRKVRRIIRR